MLINDGVVYYTPGDRFAVDFENARKDFIYILAQPNEGEYKLINLATGNRFTNGHVTPLPSSAVGSTKAVLTKRQIDILTEKFSWKLVDEHGFEIVTEVKRYKQGDMFNVWKSGDVIPSVCMLCQVNYREYKFINIGNDVGNRWADKSVFLPYGVFYISAEKVNELLGGDKWEHLN